MEGVPSLTSRQALCRWAQMVALSEQRDGARGGVWDRVGFRLCQPSVQAGGTVPCRLSAAGLGQVWPKAALLPLP